MLRPHHGSHCWLGRRRRRRVFGTGSHSSSLSSSSNNRRTGALVLWESHRRSSRRGQAMRRVAALHAHLRPSRATAEPKKSDQGTRLLIKELEAMGNTDEQGTPTDNKEPRDGVLRFAAC